MYNSCEIIACELKLIYFQDQFIQLCKTMYSMFRDDAKEQDLYQAIGRVASLLFQMGEVSNASKVGLSLY